MAAGERRNNQSEEDYLETILILGVQLPVVHRIEVAKRLKVSQAAVNKAVNCFARAAMSMRTGNISF